VMVPGAARSHLKGPRVPEMKQARWRRRQATAIARSFHIVSLALPLRSQSMTTVTRHDTAAPAGTVPVKCRLCAHTLWQLRHAVCSWPTSKYCGINIAELVCRVPISLRLHSQRR